MQLCTMPGDASQLVSRGSCSATQPIPLTPIYLTPSTYILWTDETSHQFIAEHYSWFLPTFEAYPYNIQRADVIRYFVLHRYGGVYMDLDMGCRRPVNPLLHFPVILPVTNPVGISNDLIFSEPNHPFMDAVIHNLMAFDHNCECYDTFFSYN